MMTQEEMQEVISRVEFLDWTFFIGTSPEGRLYLQIHFVDADAINGEIGVQKGRKWFLSPHMCESELVRTAHKAVHAVVEHETDERFLYRPRNASIKRRIYGPHVDVNALYEASKRIDVRQVPVKI